MNEGTCGPSLPNFDRITSRWVVSLVDAVNISCLNGIYFGLQRYRIRYKLHKKRTKKEKLAKNIQQQVFAGGHPPNY
jgi:hypothetical protein